MTSFRIRPRFHHRSDADLKEIYKTIRTALEIRNNPYSATFLPNQIILRVPLEERHFWSPQLTISFETLEDGTLIQGLYGPNPSIWAMFFFAYAILGIIIIFSGMILFSQLSLGMQTSLWWVIPVSSIMVIIIYLIAQAGQKVGAQQMFDLHHFYEDTVGTRVQIQ